MGMVHQPQRWSNRITGRESESYVVHIVFRTYAPWPTTTVKASVFLSLRLSLPRSPSNPGLRNTEKALRGTTGTEKCLE